MNYAAKKLNVIGAGRVGQTLGYLWQTHGVFELGAVVSRQLSHADAAVEFMQTGRAFDWSSIQNLPVADVWLLTCPDDELKHCCDALLQHHRMDAQTLVLHCSGALSSQEVLASAQSCGAQIASVHPIKSFADPQQAILDFSGTFCGVEGDEAALTQLIPAFEAIGAHCFSINPQEKTLYHAASVVACNYLVALQEFSLQTFAKAGVERSQAMQILQPIVEGTVANIFNSSPQAALTGPIARGDVAVVEKQLHAMREWRADYAVLYQNLGHMALQLAKQNPQFNTESAAKLDKLLSQS